MSDWLTRIQGETPTSWPTLNLMSSILASGIEPPRDCRRPPAALVRDPKAALQRDSSFSGAQHGGRYGIGARGIAEASPRSGTGGARAPAETCRARSRFAQKG